MDNVPGAPRLLGQSIARKEDQRLLTGQGCYVDDISVPGMLHACFVRSTVARGRILSIDVSEAQALPGVAAVYTATDLGPLVEPQTYLLGSMGQQPVYRPLAEGDVRYIGDPVAIILASDRYVAEDAAEKVMVDYEPEDAVMDYEHAGDLAPVHSELGGNVSFEFASPADPELDAIFGAAAHVVSQKIDQQRHACVPMETRGLVVQPLPGGELNIWLASQNVHMARRFIAQSLRLGEHQVRVVAQDVGGGFGLKYHVDRDELAVAAAALLSKRAVKWIEDRTENLMVAGQSREDRLELQVAFDDQGMILAGRLEHVENAGAYPLVNAGAAFFASIVLPGPYRFPRYGFHTRSCFTNTPGRNAYRGPWMIETVAREVMMDTAARQLGIDPVALRYKNILLAADQPYQSAGGMVFSRVTPKETLDQALQILGLEAFRAEQAQQRRDGRYLGLGISVYIEPAGMSDGVMSSDVAEIRIETSGTIVANVSAGSAGHSIETTMAQVIADEFAVGIDQIAVHLGDTAQSGFGAGAGGSRQAMVVGGAVKKAAGSLREKVLEIAAHMLEIKPGGLTIQDGAVGDPAQSNRWLSLKEIAERAYFQPGLLPPDMEPGLEARYRYAPKTAFSNATHLCVCEVDIDTGLVKILRWIVSEDCGVMINPAVVEGQVSGGVVQGIGGVLYEHTAFDADGNPQAVSFKDYLMPLAPDMPVIEFGHLQTPSDSPLGTKGVGEGGAIVAPAAMINAVTDALAPFGVSFQRLPLSPDAILSALQMAGQN